MLSLSVLIVAGLLAGGLNAVAGGGTFLSFPALVWLGVPPIMANATATLTAMPGYAGSAWAFRRDVSAEGALGLRAIMLIAVVGGLTGAGLLLLTPGKAFTGVVPWLLLVATCLFAAGPRLLSAVQSRGLAVGPWASGAAVFLVSVYGGYFNGGLGIMLLAVFGLIGFTDLHGMNGLKNVLSLVLSVVSVATFAAAGLIAWNAAIVLAIATTVGGFAGAHLSRRIRRTDLLRAGIVAVGAVMTVVFFVL